MRIRVTVVDEQGVGYEESFDKAEITIGRVTGNDLVLPSNQVSKRHARILVRSGEVVVVDAKSTNGTYIGETKLTGPTRINNGQVLILGDYEITIRY